MSRVFKTAGFAACFVAVLAICGGHWFALQSFAWGRMIADFWQQDSLGSAVVKTFSGTHPCSLCLKIRAGWHQEKQQQEKQPWLKTEKMPEMAWQLRCLTAPPAPTEPRDEQPLLPAFHTDFIDSPPSPPPRGHLATL